MNKIKQLLLGGVLALGTGCAMNAPIYETNQDKFNGDHRGNMRLAFEMPRVEHNLGREFTYFEAPRSDEESGSVDKDSWPYVGCLGLEHSYGGDYLRFVAGINGRYSFYENYANEKTGFNDTPWDVTYTAGVIPKASIEPFIGMAFRIHEGGTLEIGAGIPRTKFTAIREYKQQVNESTTELGRDNSYENGKSAYIRYRIKRKGFEEPDIIIGYSQEWYDDVEIMNHKTDIDVKRIEFGLRWRF